MSDLFIGEPDVIRKEDNILWLRAEIERLTAKNTQLLDVWNKAEDRIAELEGALRDIGCHADDCYNDDLWVIHGLVQAALTEDNPDE